MISIAVQRDTRPSGPLLRSIVLTLIVLFPAIAAAQQLPFRSYDRSSGLPSDYVTCIEQDSAGFIWFGTDRGLSRYDGRTFLTYTQSDGLPDVFITCIFPDTGGVVWFGTYQGGAVRFDRDGFTVYDTASGLPSNSVEHITRDSAGIIFFHTEAGPAALAGDSALTLPNGREKVFTLRLRDGTMICPGTDGFVRLRVDPEKGLLSEPIAFSGNLFDYSDVFQYLSGQQVTNGDVFFRYSGGLLRIRHRPDGTFSGTELVIADDIADFTEDGEGYLWVATAKKGLLKFKDSTVMHISTSDGLPSPRLEVVRVDYEGNVWISIFGQGVVKLTNSSVRRYTSDEGLLDDNTQNIFRDPRHRTWIGTQRGLNLIDGPLVRKIANKNGNMDGVRAVAFTPGGRMYVGTIRYLFGPATPESFIKGFSPPGRHIGYGVSGLDVAEPASGFDIVVGTFGDGISFVNSDTVLKTAVGNKIPSKMIEGVVPGRTGTWFLTRNEGALRFSGGEVDYFNVQNGLPSNSVYALHEPEASREGDLRVWIGTEDALTRLAGTDVRTFTARDGLRGSPVIGIHPADGPGHFAADDSPGDGEMLIVTPEAIHVVRNDAVELLEPLSFLAEGGAALNGSSYDSADGTLWLATTRGVYVMDLSVRRPAPVPPKIAITSVREGSRHIRTTGATNGRPGELSLPDLSAERNDIVIEYAGLSYINENGILYQTKLDPVDREYSDPGAGRSSLFRSLSDGNYVFHVRAVNDRNVVSGMPAVIHFRILPPFWKRWWFIGGSVFIALAFAALGTRAIFVRKMRRTLREFERRQAIQNERERISRDLHDHVGGQLASLISGLELAKRYGDSDGPRRRAVLDSLREDARTSMEQLRETIWALQSSALTLAGFSAEIRNYGNRHFRYLSPIRFSVDVTGDESIILEPQEVLELFRIVQEALSNTLKHATPTKTVVSLHSQPDGRLTLSIVNDGAGGRTDVTHPWTGRGLLNMKQRIGSLGGSIECSLEEGGVFRVTASYVRSADQAPPPPRTT